VSEQEDDAIRSAVLKSIVPQLTKSKMVTKEAVEEVGEPVSHQPSHLPTNHKSQRARNVDIDSVLEQVVENKRTPNSSSGPRNDDIRGRACKRTDKSLIRELMGAIGSR